MIRIIRSPPYKAGIQFGSNHPPPRSKSPLPDIFDMTPSPIIFTSLSVEFDKKIVCCLRGGSPGLSHPSFNPQGGKKGFKYLDLV